MSKQLDPATITEEVRPAARRFAKEIGDLANRKWDASAVMAGLIAAKTLENVLWNITIAGFKPKSEEGLKFIESVYEGSLKDLRMRWLDK